MLSKEKSVEMFNKLWSRAKTPFKFHPTLIILVIISALLCYRNYVSGAFLSGWDTLHPEFNYALYWQRILGGAWQEHQSLGAVATQAHASEIPRVIILMLMDIVLATHQVRIFYAFLMIILGPMGVYFFLKSIVLAKSDARTKEVGAFAGALFYLLNLGTLQHFYVPLEMFLTHFGFLGWIFFTASKYLNSERIKDKKNLKWFVLVTFLASSQAHTSTLFFAFLLGFGAFLGIKSLIGFIQVIWHAHKDKRVSIKKSLNILHGPAWIQLKKAIVLILLTLVTNLYWFLPNLYFGANHGKDIQQSKIHQLFSQEAFLQNTEFGNIADAAVLRNFLFNWGEHTGNAQFGDLLDEWKFHHENRFVTELGFVFFGMIVLGVLFALVKRNIYGISMLGVFLVGLFFWFNINPPLGSLFIFLQENVPLFKEAFRFPFTKFSILLILSYAVFFGVFFGAVGDLINKVKNRKASSILQIATISLVSMLLIIYMLPAFYNSFISPSMKVQIPDRYFELFDYMNSQEEYGRVAPLPIHSFWGWVYHDWNEGTQLGYQGAGFLWFGLKQPLLDREFDRWNLTNENYYQEMSTAVYSQDLDAFHQTLDKYKVKWILLDESILVISADNTVLFYDQINSMLDESSDIFLENDFGDGLKVYKYKPSERLNLYEKDDSFIYANDSLFKEYDDPIYKAYGSYVDDFDEDDTFPFVGITGAYESLDPDYEIWSVHNHILLDPGKGLGQSRIDQFDFESQFNVEIYQLDGNVVISLENLLGVVPTKDIVLDPEAISLLTGSEGVLSIAENPFLIDFSSLGSVRKDLGVVSINPSETLELSIYNPQVVLLSDETFDPVLETCSELGNQATYSLKKSSIGFDIFARQVIACVTDSIAKYKPAVDDGSDVPNTLPNLVGISFNSSSEGAEPEVCLLDSVTGLCLNTFSDSTTIYRFLDDSNLGRYFVRFYADAQDSTEEIGVSYANVKIDFPELVFTQQEIFDLLSMEEVILYEDLKFKKNESFSGDAVDWAHLPRLCGSTDPLGDSAVTEENGYLRYSAKGESVCDSYNMFELPHDTGYILEIESRNIEGIPLRLCLTNEFSKRCDIYVSLHEDDEFKKEFFMIPPIGEGTGYTFNLSNLVFGDGTNVSDLKYIGVAPIPYEALRNINTGVETNVEGENLLIYNQAYEKGWVAMCGLSRCDAEHVKVNNWANGWIFNDTIKLSQIYVFFWPQVLEVIGLIILVGTFVWVFFPSKNFFTKIKDK